MREITVAAFATQAPLYTEFFAAESIDLARAKAGEKLFGEYCARCHGQYDKAWSRPDAEGLFL